MLPFEVHATDQRFAESPDAGDPSCVCSRCGTAIPETTIPIRATAEDGSYEYRYHPGCVGIELPTEEDWPLEEEWCTTCGAPMSECCCPRSDPLDDVDANTRGDIW